MVRRKINTITNIVKIGNSQGIIIPKKYLKYLMLNVGDQVKVTLVAENEKEIIIKKEKQN